MIELLDEKVSVISVYERKKGTFAPSKINWNGHTYLVTKIGFHHHFHQGRVLHHIFSVVCTDMFFRLNFNTETLSWVAEEISDNGVN